MATICEVVERYPYIAMDTEFPGTVARPVGTFRPRSSEEKYQSIRCNVDLLNIIQLGVTFCDEDGNLAPGCSTWQFNFTFSLQTDLYAQDSIELLTQAGIDFNKHEAYGIDPLYFAELLMVSGVVLCDDVRWISFHSGYDFGYLLKVLTCKPLPETEGEFLAALQVYFPCIYDIKCIANSTVGDHLKGGLNKIAEQLKVQRIGPEHQAGSDSLLTQAVFFELKRAYFNNHLDDDQYLNKLWGLDRSGPDRPGGPYGSPALQGQASGSLGMRMGGMQHPEY